MLKRMKWNQIIRQGACLVIFIILVPLYSWADIYVYRDSSGVLHFTNAPTSPHYQIYVHNYYAPFHKAFSSGRFESYIAEAAQRYQVAPSLLKAIIKVESDYNPRAVSKKGAMGLMQIMPQNFKALNLNNPFNPRENILAGTNYFRQMLDRYNGQLPLALAAYNAGPTRVDRHFNIPPIAETENYVNKVLKYYYDYR